MEFYPVTSDRWSDLVTLFEERGPRGGVQDPGWCWCMWWRVRKKEFQALKTPGRRQTIKDIIDSGEAPGILAYLNGSPVGWCSIAPREAFPRLEGTRTMKRLDDAPVWSIVCLFVSRSIRRQGLSVKLLKAAVDFARSKGARIVEGYPTQPGRDLPPGWGFMGLVSAFRQAGFSEVARPSKTRRIMRYAIRRPRRT